MDKHIILGSAVSDSLYSFNTVIENHSSSIKKYYLSSTCGCTVISYDVKKLSPKMTDTIEVIINTYGKKHNFSSNLFLFNENHVLLDTMLIDVKGF